MEYLDSHCHLNDEALLPRLDEVMKNASEADVRTILCVGWDLESSKKAVEIAEKYSGVYAAVGIHPENLNGINEESISELRRIAQNPKVIAVGEIGLDYHWFKDAAVREKQKTWFVRQIDLANELSLPISVHARDASEDTLKILQEHPLNHSGVLHCYSGSTQLLKEFAKLGFYFGFDGPITYQGSIVPKANVLACPLDRILSETDSPYLTPIPFRGLKNEPKNIPQIVKMMAVVKGISELEIIENISQNFARLFHVEL
jgi:TatD DNase family protein